MGGVVTHKADVLFEEVADLVVVLGVLELFEALGELGELLVVLEEEDYLAGFLGLGEDFEERVGALNQFVDAGLDLGSELESY